jgi:hypothetical protein
MDVLRKHSKLAVALCFCLFLSSSVLPSASALTIGSTSTAPAPAQEGPTSQAVTLTSAVLAVGLVVTSYQLGKIVGEAAYEVFGPEEEIAQTTLLLEYRQHKPMDFSKFDG